MSAEALLAERVLWVEESTQDDVPSPCLSVCRMDSATSFCEGCYRTIEEIAAWSRMGDDEKRGVWKLIGLRLESPHPNPLPTEAKR